MRTSSLLLPVLALGCANAVPARTGLNVLVESFDAMRADAIGAYGYFVD